MSERSHLVRTLKGCLKSRGLTYEDVARELSLSESSVKRLFSEESLTLERLEQICALIDLSFYELAKLAQFGAEGPEYLSTEQEDALANDSNLFAFFYLLLRGAPLSEIASERHLTENDMIPWALALERLGLVRLMPKNRVRVLVSRQIQWQPDGPLRRLYEKPMLEEFLGSNFIDDNAWCRFVCSNVSTRSMAEFKQKFEKILKDLDSERTSAIDRDTESFGLLIAFRPWTFSFVSKLSK